MAKKQTEEQANAWTVVDPMTFDLVKNLSSIKVRNDILARVVKWQLAKRRAGTHETKEEADVSGSGKKMFRQKGTGNARQGASRAPHMRGGAVIFGPHMRDHGYSLQKKVRRMGLAHAIAAKIQRGEFKIVETLNVDTYKTKIIAERVKNITPSSKVLFVDDNNDNLLLGVRSIIGADVIPVIGLNVYDILKHEVLVMSKDSFSAIEKRLGANG